MNSLLPILATSLLLANAACDTATEGASGNVEFTPTNCGRIGCDFEDSIGVGGTIDVRISGIGGLSTAGADLVSDDPSLLSVTAIGDTTGPATWELRALAAGVARLSVIDASDALLDFIEVPIQELTGLVALNILGDAIGPADDASYDQVWTVNADEGVSFQITPVIGVDAPTMGRYIYSATLDSALENGLIEEDPSEGYLYFNVPAGQYAASFEDDFGHTIDLLFIAE